MAEDPTQSDNPGDELDWIPENFRRDTIEETARAAIDSSKEAQRKITEEATKRRNLEQMLAEAAAREEQWQARAAQQPEADPNEWYTAFEADPIATQRALAEQTFDQKFSQWQASQQQNAQAVQGSQTEIVVDLARKGLEDQVGPLTPENWVEIGRVLETHPHLIPPGAEFSPEKLKSALLIVHKVAGLDTTPQQSQADLQRTMKLQAQTATGAGGHLSTADEDAQRWQEITNASTGKLGL